MKILFDELKIAKHDKEQMEKKYNYKFSDNRIDIPGKDIKIEKDGLSIYMLPANDLRNFAIGHLVATNVCFNECSEGVLLNITSNPLSSYIVIEDNKGQIHGAIWAWTDKKHNDTLVFDYIEFDNISNYTDPKYTNIIMEYIKALPQQNIQINASYGNYDIRKYSLRSKIAKDDILSIPQNEHVTTYESYYNNIDLSDYCKIKININTFFIKKDGISRPIPDQNKEFEEKDI